MKKYVPLEEQETTINMFPKKISDRAEIYTCDPLMINRLNKLVSRNPDQVEVLSDDQYGMTVSVDRKWIKISAPRRVTMTDEQRKASAERLSLARKEKKK